MTFTQKLHDLVERPVAIGDCVQQLLLADLVTLLLEAVQFCNIGIVFILVFEYDLLLPRDLLIN